MSFEGHPDDLRYDEIINQGTSGYSIVIESNNALMLCQGNKYFYINQEFSDYLEFSMRVYNQAGTNWQDHYIGIELYDSANNIIFSDTTMASLRLGGGDVYNNYHVSFKENSAGNGIDCYVNGLKYDSTLYLIQQHAAITKIKIVYGSMFGGAVRFDDFTDHPSIISCDSQADWTDSNQYFRVSHPTYVYTTWDVKVVAPDGTIIQTEKNADSISSYSISTALMNFSGTYDIILYANESQFGNYYLLDSRSFYFTRPSTNTLTSTDSIKAGSSLKVTWGLNPYISGCTIKCVLPGDTTLSYDVSSESGSTYFQIPSNIVSGNAVLYLKSPTGATLAIKTVEIIGIGQSPSISLDKDVYFNNDRVQITYNSVPQNSEIRLQGSYFGYVNFADSWTKTGSGILFYQLPGLNTSTITVTVVNNNEVLASDTAKIAYGDDYLLQGVVYDSVTQTPLSGANITIQGSTTYNTTSNEVGRYSVSLSPGRYTISTSMDGYNTRTETITISETSTKKNIYLVKVTDYGAAIYGDCADYVTGSPINNVLIQISNESAFFTMLTGSTGTYVFEDLPEGSTWTLTATKTGYDTYKKNILVSGSTYHPIKLTSQDYADSGSSGSTGSTSTTDRPSREAAIDSLTWLESTMPNLIKLAVVVFMLALIGWRF